MRPLLNVHIDILALASETPTGAPMPPPRSLQESVMQLIAGGLLVDQDGRAFLTAEGRTALSANADSVLSFGAV